MTLTPEAYTTQPTRQGINVEPTHSEDLGAHSLPETHLVLFGGAARPAPALQRFINDAGGTEARILVVPWATEEPRETFEAFKTQVNTLPHGIKTELICAPSYEQMIEYESDRSRFLAQLHEATGVYFTGGSQQLILDVVQHQDLLEAIRDRFFSGIPMAGTSAGTAVSGVVSLLGNERDFARFDPELAPVAPALGLVPGTIVDQHFLERYGRWDRMMNVMRNGSGGIETGIGIPEQTAAVITHGEDFTDLEVIMTGEAIENRSELVVFHKINPNQVVMTYLTHGDHYDLKNHHHTPPAAPPGGGFPLA